jgi:MYXO-CTERM domain-containing protein
MRCLIPFATAAAALVPALAHADTLQVGPGKPYATIAAGVAAAASGDTIEIDAGDYVDDIVTIDSKDLTLRGVGDARAHLSATGQIGNGKGIIVIGGTSNIVVEHLEFSGATVADENGAGIRMQGASLVVDDCHFHDNQNGILAGGDAPYTLEVSHSEFDHNGNPGSGQEHNVYVSGDATSFTFQGNYTHHSYSGHTFKSRAQVNYVLYNRIMDEADGTGSYLIDLPQGGLSYVIGNLIEKGPAAENTGTVINYKGEGQTNAQLRLFVVNNTIVNDNGSTPAFVRIYAADDVVLRNNLFVGQGTPIVLEPGAAPTIVDEGNLQTDMPGLVDQAGYDYHLVDGSPAIDAGVAAGADGDYDLTPTMHYVHPAGLEPRPVVDAMDIGAYEFGMGPPAGETGGDTSGGADSGSSGDSAATADGSASSGDGGSDSTITAGSAATVGEDSSGGSAGAGDDDGGGCGCRSTPRGAAAAWWIGLAAVLVRRRRTTA